ncbi:MAG: acyltransferase family protein [Candidatus Gastranaerophilaceae bacterium]
MHRYNNIDFLRIIGVFSVIIFHMFNNIFGKIFSDIPIYIKMLTMTHNGQIAVDLFFIISGLFFCLKLNKDLSMWQFIKKKLIRLYPMLIFGIILSFVFSLTGSFEFTYYDNVLMFFGLSGTSLVLKRGNVSVFWYVSAMLWVLIPLFYLIKNYSIKNINLLLGILIFVSYSIILRMPPKGEINYVIPTFYKFINVGMLRAIAGIGVGYFIGEWYKSNMENIINIRLSALHILIISILEFVSLYFIINNLFFHRLKYQNQIVFIIVFTIIIVLFLISKGIISKLLNSVNFYQFSKYTYSLYITHLIVLDYLACTLWKNVNNFVYIHPILNFVFTLIFIFAIGIFTHHLIEVPVQNYFKRTSENRHGCRESNPSIC